MRKLITQFCNFIFGKHKNNTLPRVWILAVDMVIVIVAYFIATIMLYFQDIKASGFDWSRIWIVPITYLIVFLASRTYDGMLRYAGFNDIRKIFTACTSTVAMLIISKLILVNVAPHWATELYPRYVTLVYHYLITLTLMILMRFTIRRLYNEVYKNVPGKDSFAMFKGAVDYFK